ncbi:hypothetical protein [Segniliparus rugosus]|uniref:Lipoprotein n=1 Tax=Segniliparus rugosus (strain ATCC BAA-974 / DSM 45345 / CCUG 50838 / CIP 108380 / JCM 13579 / CDC 945) TaxID=679197 RepID=E5XUQ6_SEGRC|nr:hypothetical protein [Segniliparus rugosus]EFV11894.1 hypothetical protein HMPREF9336_03228 [Segniliparus rugosus ATCC BAA-974]
MRRALILLPVLAFCAAGCSESRKTAPATTTQLPPLASSQAPATPSFKASPSTTASTSAAVTGLGAFVGEWHGHGRLLTVGADGSGKIVARTYQKCGDPGVTGACDTFDGNEIKPGAVTQIKITGTHEVADGAEAEFSVQESTLGVPPNSTGTLVLDQTQDTVRIVINGKPGAGAYCGPKADPGACGA